MGLYFIPDTYGGGHSAVMQSVCSTAPVDRALWRHELNDSTFVLQKIIACLNSSIKYLVNQFKMKQKKNKEKESFTLLNHKVQNFKEDLCLLERL